MLESAFLLRKSYTKLKIAKYVPNVATELQRLLLLTRNGFRRGNACRICPIIRHKIAQRFSMRGVKPLPIGIQHPSRSDLSPGRFGLRIYLQAFVDRALSQAKRAAQM